MFEVTDLATENLKTYMEQNKIDSALRVSLMSGGWSGPSLGLALDEPKDSDSKYEQDGMTFLVDNSLLDTCGSIKIDFIDAGMRSGFSISSTNPIGDGGGGCSGGSCSSSGCGWFLLKFSAKYPRWFSAGGIFLSFLYPTKLSIPKQFHAAKQRNKVRKKRFGGAPRKGV